jgi:hypothetical protein
MDSKDRTKYMFIPEHLGNSQKYKTIYNYISFHPFLYIYTSTESKAFHISNTIPNYKYCEYFVIKDS